MEIFCGTAGVSAAFKRNGFNNYIAIDKLVPGAPKASVTKLDLTVHVNQQLVFSWIRAKFIQAVFLAPPCGTASQARAIVLEDVPDAPVPLRSESAPDGLDDLTGLDLIRVTQANILYGFVADCWDLCCELGVPCMVENPLNSLFWLVTAWVERKYAGHEVSQPHQACGYGSLRPKWTKLVANFQSVTSINKTCPGNHKHESWGLVRAGSKRRFATSMEVHYPNALCEAIVHAFILQFVKMGMELPTPPRANADAQAFSGMLPATTATQLFLPEFKNIAALIFDAHQNQLWPFTSIDVTEAKLLSSSEVGGTGMVDVQKLVGELQDTCKAARAPVDLCNLSVTEVMGPLTVKIFGFYWSVQEFLEQAQQVVHPLAVERVLPTELVDVVKDNASMEPFALAKLRTQFVAKWSKRASELSAQEAELKETMDPVVAQTMKHKRLCLFREMLQEYSYPDIQVVDELIEGASLVGNVAATGMLPRKFQPALITEDELRNRSWLVRDTIMEQHGSSGDPQLDEQVWAKTLDEVAQGWLVGPLHDDDVDRTAPISRRFGLQQKQNKVRLIDDYTESGVNSCVGTEESPSLHTIDIACALLTMWFSECNRLGRDSVLTTRTFDLTSAYRQIGLNAGGRDFAHLRVFCPESNNYKLFRSNVLPFGAVRSVHTFLRCARAIWWLGVVGCRLMWTSFYDDFICFSQHGLARCTELSVESLFKMLGWLFAEDGDKCQPFDNTCNALGVLFSLKDSAAGCARVHNTQKRIDEVCAEIDEVITAGKLTMKAAQKLRGRMQFADAQVWGKNGKRCLRTLKEFACGNRFKLTSKDVFFLGCFRDMLRLDRPRLIRAPTLNNILIFTDACYERDSTSLICGIGGVIIFPFGDVRYFAIALDAEQRDILGENKKKQIIFEAETLSALLALHVWCKSLVDDKCIFFVDNEGCKFALLKGLSDNLLVDVMAELFVGKEDSVEVPLWLARVPSKSNLADEPSRFVFERLHAMNALNCSHDAANVLDDLFTLIEMGARNRDLNRP